MRRAHGLAIPSAIGLAVLFFAGEARAVGVDCADASRLEVETPSVFLRGDFLRPEAAAAAGSAAETEVTLGVLCGPRPLLQGVAIALREGFDGARRAGLSALSTMPDGSGAFDLPDPVPPHVGVAGSRSELLITGAPIAIAVGEATREDRRIATFSLGPGSVYNGLHFSPLLAIRVGVDAPPAAAAAPAVALPRAAGDAELVTATLGPFRD